MICPNCGTSCPDDAMFCPNCGTKVESQSTKENKVKEDTPYVAPAPAQNVQGASPQYNPQMNPQYTTQYNPQVNPQYGQQYSPPRCGSYYAQRPYQPQAPNMGVQLNESAAKVLAALKSVASSPLFLIAAILLSLSVLLGFIDSLFTYANSAYYLEQMAEFLDMLDMGDFAYELYGYSGDSSIISTMIGLIPSVLLVVGIWMTYASAMSRCSAFVKTSGLTMVQVVVIIELVALSIFLGLSEFLLIFALIAATGFGAPEEVVIVVCVAMVLVALIMTILIMYYAKINKTISVVKSTAVTGIASDRVSMFVAVLNFICGFFSVVSALLSFLVSGPLTVISGLCSSVAMILFGVIIVVYRGKMQSLVTPMPWQQTPAYVHQAPGAYQPYQSAQTSYYQNGNGVQGTYPQSAPQQPAPATIVCPNCGCQCDAQASVCQHCGMTLKNQ